MFGTTLGRVACVAVTVGTVVVAPAAVASAQTGLGVVVTIAPSSEPEGVYRATAALTDLDSGRLLFAPTLRFVQGDRVEAETGSLEDELVRFEIAVSEDGAEATYKVELLRDGELVASQEATIRLTDRP